MWKLKSSRRNAAEAEAAHFFIFRSDGGQNAPRNLILGPVPKKSNKNNSRLTKLNALNESADPDICRKAGAAEAPHVQWRRPRQRNSASKLINKNILFTKPLILSINKPVPGREEQGLVKPADPSATRPTGHRWRSELVFVDKPKTGWPAPRTRGSPGWSHVDPNGYF